MGTSSRIELERDDSEPFIKLNRQHNKYSTNSPCPKTPKFCQTLTNFIPTSLADNRVLINYVNPGHVPKPSRGRNRGGSRRERCGRDDNRDPRRDRRVG